MSCPVVLDHERVIHGNVRGTLLEIPHRIAAALHHFLDQPISLVHGRTRIVHESRLLVAPHLRVTLAVGIEQRPDSQPLDAPLPAVQLPLPATTSPHPTLVPVLRTQTV